MNNSNRERLNVAVQALDSLPSTSEDDSLFKSFASLAISLKQDSLHWSQLNTVQMEELRNLSRIPSSIQNNALSVRLLIGDTLYHHNPDPSPNLSLRLSHENSIKVIEGFRQINMKLNPNPSSNFFQVSLNNENGIKWELIDLTGRIILNGITKQSQFTVYCAELNSGIYLFKIVDISGNYFAIERILIK